MIIMKAGRIIISLLALFMLVSSVASAQTYQIMATGTYSVGDRDTRETAKKHAVQDAMRIAVEKAGVYVESYSEVKNYELTRDEVRMVAAGIVKVVDEHINFYDNGMTCKAFIQAVVDTSDINPHKIMEIRSIGGRNYRVSQQRPQSSSYNSYGASRERPVTALIIDYSRFRDSGSHILPLGVNDCIKSEDGTIVYDKAIGGLEHGDLCYMDSYAARVYAKAGNHPIIVEPIYFEKSTGYSYYWKNPVLKKEDADYIMDMNDQYHFLEHNRVYIIGVESFH